MRGKVILILTVMIVSFSLFGCGTNTTTYDNENANVENEESTEISVEKNDGKVDVEMSTNMPEGMKERIEPPLKYEDLELVDVKFGEDGWRKTQTLMKLKNNSEYYIDSALYEFKFNGSTRHEGFNDIGPKQVSEEVRISTPDLVNLEDIEIISIDCRLNVGDKRYSVKYNVETKKYAIKRWK